MLKIFRIPAVRFLTPNLELEFDTNIVIQSEGIHNVL